MPNNALAKVDTVRVLGEQYFAPKSPLLLAIRQALPQAIIPPESLVRGALTAIRMNQALQLATKYSLICSIVEAAQVGLSLDVNLGQAYLVPYSGVAKLMYGYRGMCELARRSGEVGTIVGELRYEKDKFRRTLGSHREIIHEPLDKPDSKRGEIVGVYAIVEYTGGRRPDFEYLDIEVIRKLQASIIKRKKGSKEIPWESNFEEMARKTPIRRIAKRMPQSPGLVTFVRGAIRDDYRENVRGFAEKEPDFFEENPDLGVVAEAVAGLGITPDEPKEEQKVDAAVDVRAGANDPISDNQVQDIVTLMCDYKLNAKDLATALAAIGHKDKVATLPRSKAKALFEQFEKIKKG